jgi:hypothetical protein
MIDATDQNRRERVQTHSEPHPPSACVTPQQLDDLKRPNAAVSQLVIRHLAGCERCRMLVMNVEV